jgi:hypothetical protein
MVQHIEEFSPKLECCPFAFVMLMFSGLAISAVVSIYSVVPKFPHCSRGWSSHLGTALGFSNQKVTPPPMSDASLFAAITLHIR